MIQVEAPPPEVHQLVLAAVGRFAVFADIATVTRGPEGVRMRSLQVVDEDFAVGTKRYWGGWSWWRFDCDAGTADRLDFASIEAGGREGPVTPDTTPASPTTPGGDAAGLAAVACGAGTEPGDATTLEAAVALGRTRLAE
jgi:hypothetical protein